MAAEPVRPLKRRSARVTTRTGDDGYTGLIGPSRVAKYDERIETLGALDEATSSLGLARAMTKNRRVAETIESVQRDLYHLMADVATDAPGAASTSRIDDARLTWVEIQVESLREEAVIPSAFIIPGASVSGAAIDVARAVVRRGERQLARLVHTGVMADSAGLRYLNRCSDLLHILARYDEVSQGLAPPTQT